MSEVHHLVSRETIDTIKAVIFYAAMAWLLVGSLCWMILDSLGIVRSSHIGRLTAGWRYPRAHTVAATLGSIVAWPIAIRGIAKHPRATARRLAKNLWGRS